ncbi:hypothetical protein [Vallicoccus soli]|uniref:Uncharacterized protein n=1 Tax=Vallicoccus soli TaxID=2339232 RepID=A0A3A3ZC77_9ACTN|nr:hypothetical protein [Vallicoccus soli]RJK92760.1 hypothetical protein D5H78_17980 [Vallicoccus soli]
MEEMLGLALVLFVVAACALGTGVAVLVLVARRLVLAASEGLGDLTLRAASYGVGRRPSVGRLRLALRTELDAARRAVAAAREQGLPLGDAPALVGRLQSAARELDARLRTLGREPDADVVRRALPGLRAEVEVVTRSAADLRGALLASGSAVQAEELRALGDACALESRALRTR